MSDARTLTNILVGWAGSSRDRRAVLLWHGRIPRRVRRVASVALDAHQLSIDARLLRAFIAPERGGLSTRATARLLRLGRGRPTLVYEVLDVATLHGRELTTIEEMLRAGAWRPAFIGPAVDSWHASTRLRSQGTSRSAKHLTTLGLVMSQQDEVIALRDINDLGVVTH